jgi:outer membrane receptor protein involved in Fe transport
MGVDVEYRRYHMVATGSSASGGYSFLDLADFLAAFPDSFSAQLQDVRETERRIVQWLPGMYFQDNWQVRPSLTLNLGLRYEFATLPKEDDNKVANLVAWVNDKDTTNTIVPKAMALPSRRFRRFCRMKFRKARDAMVFMSFPRDGIQWGDTPRDNDRVDDRQDRDAD